MDNYAKTLLFIQSDKISRIQLVQIIELSCNKLNINTISGMAKSEKKSFNGIKKSNKYYKLNIGEAKLVVSGLKNDNLPW